MARTEGRENAESQQTPLMTTVNEDDEKLSQTQQYEEDFARRPAPTSKHRALSFALSTFSFFAGILLTILIMVATGLPKNSPGLDLPKIVSGTDEKTGQPAHWFNGNCGNSAAEAKSRGCEFDLVSHSWLPKDCLYEEDAADAELMYANNTWHWGLDDTTEVSLEDVKKGEYERVWTSMDWHVTHCGFIWKRLHRAVNNPGRRLDSYTADYHHTSHCVDMIAGLSPVESINATGTRIYTKFPTCS